MDIHELKQFESVYQPSKEIAFCWLRKQYVQLSTEENHAEVVDHANDSLRIWQATKAQAVSEGVVLVSQKESNREAFEKEMLNSRYVAGNISAFWDKKTQDYDIAITELRMAWHAWQAAKAQSEKALLEQFEINNKLVEQIEKLKDQAKDTERLNFLLAGEHIRTVVKRDIENDDYEVVGSHYLFTELYWIDGFDYYENTSAHSERDAIDKAMIEAQEQAND